MTANGTTQVLAVAPPACSASPPISCTYDIVVPSGSASIVVATYDGANATGSVLNVGRTVVTVPASGPAIALQLTLSDWVVTSTKDAGGGTLRAALANATLADVSGQIIGFLIAGPGPPWTISLSSGSLQAGVGV